MLLEEGSRRPVWPCHPPAQRLSAAPDIPQARPSLLGMAEETPSRPFQACCPCLRLLIRSALAVPIWVSCVPSLLYLTGSRPLLGALFLLHYSPFIRPLANRHLQADAAFHPLSGLVHSFTGLPPSIPIALCARSVHTAQRGFLLFFCPSIESLCLARGEPSCSACRRN